MSYYIAPKFFDKVAVHITKNFLDLPLRIPLILGIHGRKGEGKSFQCELMFKKMGIEAVHMSAGELESPDAGDPARLIRLRYREAAEVIKVRGRMCVLMINDLDAGAGRFDQGTQYTVNTQLVNGTLMNIADNPTDVQLPGSYDSTPLPRIPIIVTGNDFSTLYAPLIRDGRMEKFYWEPNRDDKVGIVGGIFADDGLSSSEVEQLVDTFPGQAIDFYSALRSRIYDEQIRRFIHEIGIERISQRVVNSTEGKPVFDKPNFRLPQLLEFGNLMVREQEQVENTRLVDEYNLGGKLRLQKIEHSPNEKPVNSQSFSNEASKSATYVEKEVSKTINRNDIANEPITHHQEGNGQPTKRPSKDMIAQLQQIIQGGYRVGIEYVDPRRFRMNSWQSYATVSNDEGEAIATLADCLTEHDSDYIRLIGIDPKAKRRVVETIIQRPNN